MDAISPMMTQREASEYIAFQLCVSSKNVYDRYVHLPGFPRPIRLPTSGKTGDKRYRRHEIVDWVNRQTGITT